MLKAGKLKWWHGRSHGCLYSDRLSASITFLCIKPWRTNFGKEIEDSGPICALIFGSKIIIKTFLCLSVFLLPANLISLSKGRAVGSWLNIGISWSLLKQWKNTVSQYTQLTLFCLPWVTYVCKFWFTAPRPIVVISLPTRNSVKSHMIRKIFVPHYTFLFHWAREGGDAKEIQGWNNLIGETKASGTFFH